MTIEEIREQIDFAYHAMENVTKSNGVRAIVTLGNKTKVVLNIKEIGFNDKEGMIYIEVGD